MQNTEKEYLRKIEDILENFGTIQRNFVLDKSGLEAVIKLVEELSRGTPSFSIDDPILMKGENIIQIVITELTTQLENINNIRPPADWKKFHNTLSESVKLQLDGYKEMSRIFKDYRVQHIHRGRILINQGLRLLEGGERT